MSLTITVLQTRNNEPTDAQYIASKKIIIPCPLETRFVSLSDLGFGDPNQKFLARRAFHPRLWIAGGQHNGRQWMEIGELREALSYDEGLGITLTVIELHDMLATQNWAKEQARLQRKQRHADQVVHLKRLLTHPIRIIRNTGICSQASELM